MEEALTAALLGFAPLTDLVADRIHWDMRPQGGALPCVVVQDITARFSYTHSGRDNLVATVVQLDGYGATKATVVAIKRALIAFADGLSEPPLEAEVRSARGDLEVGDAPPPDGVSASDIRRTLVELDIWTSEP